MKKKFLPLLLVGVVVISLPLILSPIVHAEEENPLSVTLCVKNSGTVFMIGQGFKVADCKNNDKLININLSQGTQGPKGDKGDTGNTGPQGEVGPQGYPGADGANGIDGTDGLNGKDGIDGTNGTDGINGTNGVSGWYKSEGPVIPTTGTDLTTSAKCPAGKKVVGGGFITSNTVTYYNYYTLNNYPSADDEWTASIHRANGSHDDWSLKVYAICVTAN